MKKKIVLKIKKILIKNGLNFLQKLKQSTYFNNTDSFQLLFNLQIEKYYP